MKMKLGSKVTLRKAGKTKPSPMNHGKGGVVGQLVSVEFTRRILYQ